MLVGEARAAARDWVERHAATAAGFRGAFLAGSAAHRGAREVQPPWSDVDVRVVVEGPLPAKPGKLLHNGVLLDVDVVAVAQLTDVDRVAESHHLAPCFAVDGVLADPTGLLRLLQAAIAPTFATPAAVHRRCSDVATTIRSRLAARDPSRSWAEVVTAWMFPASLLTHVVLVAAVRAPTVRLRYPAAREVLLAADRPDLYERMLAVLGCAAVDPAVVGRHLDRLEDAFDEAATLARSPFFFSSDITPVARPIAIDGSRRLIATGDHREAVFWIVATHARCRQILDADGPEAARAAGEARFRAAVAELLGLRDADDVLRRASAVRALLPEVETAAVAIIGSGGFAGQGSPGTARV